MIYASASPAGPLARRWTWLAAGALLALAAFYALPDASIPVPPPPSHAPSPAVFAPGPGLLRDAAMEAPPADIGNNGPLALTPDQHLEPNAALRDVLDFFLLARADDAAKAALKDYLARKLPPRALADALQIADNYLAYIAEHDALLAAQGLHLQGASMTTQEKHLQHANVATQNPPLQATSVTPQNLASVTTAELVRLSGWCEQRARLRLRILGKPLVQAWFQDEDLQTQQAIDELQRGDEQPDYARTQESQANGATPFRPVPHWSNPADAERHRIYLLGLLTRSATSFETQRHAQAAATPAPARA